MKHVKNKAPQSPAAAHCRTELFQINLEVRGVMTSVHELSLLVDEAWQSDCPTCRGLLLRHVRVEKLQKDGVLIVAACGAVDGDNRLVEAALASDCDDCRTAVGVALVRDKSWSGETYGIRPEAVFDPAPMENADEICASARENRG